MSIVNSDIFTKERFQEVLQNLTNIQEIENRIVALTYKLKNFSVGQFV